MSASHRGPCTAGTDVRAKFVAGEGSRHPPPINDHSAAGVRRDTTACRRTLSPALAQLAIAATARPRSAVRRSRTRVGVTRLLSITTSGAGVQPTSRRLLRSRAVRCIGFSRVDQRLAGGSWSIAGRQTDRGGTAWLAGMWTITAPRCWAAGGATSDGLPCRRPTVRPATRLSPGRAQALTPTGSTADASRLRRQVCGWTAATGWTRANSHQERSSRWSPRPVPASASQAPAGLIPVGQAPAGPVDDPRRFGSAS